MGFRKIKEKIKKVWKKLKNKVKSLFKKKKKKKSLVSGVISVMEKSEAEAPPMTPATAPPLKVEPPKDPYGGKPPGEYVGWKDVVKHPMNNWEPLKTEKADRVNSFLWKPNADHKDTPVIVVSCDKVRRMDLYVELYDSNWKLVPTGGERSIGNPTQRRHSGNSRGNRIHKYARINFYLKKTPAQFQKHGALNVKFYQLINGQKHYLQIMKTKKDYFVINDANKRYDKR